MPTLDMNQRVHLLARHGDRDPYLIAAILGIDVDGVSHALTDPEFQPTGPGATVPLSLDAAAASDPVLDIGIDGEAQDRLQITADGSFAWADPAADPNVRLGPDPVNWGNGGLGLYPGAFAGGAALSFYDPNLALDGTLSGPNASIAMVGSQNGASQFSAFTWSSPSNARLMVTSDSGDPSGNYFGTISLTSDPGADVAQKWLWVRHGEVTHAFLEAHYDGSFHWGAGGNTNSPDTTLLRAAAGVLQIPEHGGGIKLTSPDGSQTKQIQLSNAGALVVV